MLRRSMSVSLRASPFDLLSAFGTWLRAHPIADDPVYTRSGARYHVARYCEYLSANPWAAGDPLREQTARDGAVAAYRAYLETFGAAEATIRPSLISLDRFYAFLGLGAPAR
jgi:hypothetical protein